MGQEVREILRMLFVTGFALFVAVNGKTKMRRGEEIMRGFFETPEVCNIDIFELLKYEN